MESQEGDYFFLPFLLVVDATPLFLLHTEQYHFSGVGCFMPTHVRWNCDIDIMSKHTR